MPERIWGFSRTDSVSSLSLAIVRTGDSLRLRRIDPETGRYHPQGELESGEAILPGVPAAALSSFYGLRTSQDEAGGSIRYQVSTDGGSTFQWHNGTAWQAVTSSTDWNSAEEVDGEIHGLAVAPDRHLTLAVRIVPSPDGRRSPVLRRIAAYLEYDYDLEEDIPRSLKRHVEEHMSIRALWRGSSAGTSVDIETDLDVHPPIAAFDLADDPGRVHDLSAGIDDRTVTLSQPATGTVEVRFRGRPSVHIAADVDYQLSQLPSVALQFQRFQEIRKLRDGDCKIDWALARRFAKVRLQPVWLAATVIVSCQSDKKRETLAMAAALASILQQQRTVRSLATGEEFAVTAYGPSNVADQVGEELSVIQTAVTLVGPAWLDEAEEKRLAEVIGFGLGSMQTRYQEIEVR